MSARVSRLPRRVRDREGGFSLLEVLIGIVVFSIGLLGMASLQMNALKNNQSSAYRMQAVVLSYFMFDAMRANRADVENGNYNLAKTCNIPAPGSTLVSNDQRYWLGRLKESLGDADTTCGEIDCDGMNCTVRVYWDDSRAAGGSDAQVFETSSRL
ncbi:type IV pilus modification protein PilV [Azoarcus olearius]|uniref:Prepilin-like protein n=1 Tax=Azoarcus sp. (strain BH72) TaxID=418699 RepID=A1K9M5_AZOSB|nr:type IV pilus modification protein PilV [Azoarcus olearius]ANQ86082.1 putative prepilin-like protein [Azoarcus olearius]CAL95530.1 putative prepilin-like protein [Azoarcus olearius]